LDDGLTGYGRVGLVVEQRFVAGADDHQVDAVAGQCGRVHLQGEPTGLGVHGLR
jgi:hypothetical protein